MSRRTFSYLPHTKDAVVLLGSEIARARREQKMTAVELAERVGISPRTLHNIEKGDPRVGIGIFFETAVILGVELFGAEAGDLGALVERSRDRLAALPAYVRDSEAVDDDF